MPTTNDVSRAVAKAIKQAPCSVRALAREAGVPHVSLALIVAGTRNATPAVAKAVATALKRWSRKCERAATHIEEAL